VNTAQIFGRKIDKQAWMRFLVGLAGLLFALFAAIFSTALTQSGYVIGAAISATIALLSAGLVGLYVVPYLAKRVVRERWMDAFEYEITKEGIVYLATVLVIAIAALNTGNNLLFIIISAMLSAMVISGLASAMILRWIRVELVLPEHLFAKQAVIARIRMANPRRFPIFSIQVSTTEEGKGKLEWKQTQFRFPPRRKQGEEWFTLNDWRLERSKPTTASESPEIQPVYFPFMPGRSSAHSDVSLTFPRRGVYRQKALAVSTRFPFSYVKKTRRVSLEREVIVLPDVHGAEELLGQLPSLAGDYESVVRGHGHDLYRIREHVAGDSARSVDWKATARTGSVMVREFTRDDDRRVRVVFDNPVTGAVPAERYEEMVSAAASLAWQFSRSEMALEFVAQDHHSTDVLDFLEYLAVVSPSAQTGHLPELADDAFTVVVTAGAWRQASSQTHILSFRPETAK
jgi:uncharacterized protein (DUF58 family)